MNTLNPISRSIILLLVVFVANACADEQTENRSVPERYNQAVALFESGEIETAASEFQQLAGADEDTVAARARFNLGNCLYSNALEAIELDHEKAIDQLRKAIEQYRSALKIDPSDDDGRANAEMARQLIEQLEQQQQSTEEDQPQSPPDESDSDENQQDEESQSSDESDSDENQPDGESQSSDESDSDENQPDGESQSSDEPNQSTDATNQEQQDAQEPSESDEQSASNQESDPQSQQPSDDQQQADSEPEPEPESESDAEPNTQGELAESGTAEQDDAESSGDRDEEPIDAVGMMTEDEADKMLQAIRDRDMLRRLRKQYERREQQIPVDKDW